MNLRLRYNPGDTVFFYNHRAQQEGIISGMQIRVESLQDGNGMVDYSKLKTTIYYFIDTLMTRYTVAASDVKGFSREN